MPNRKRIGILGSGIMGTSLALMLSKRGFDVSVFEQEDSPVSGASRWNEGKIHLGYLYAADPTMQTAERVIPGGLRFAQIVSELIGTDLSRHVTSEDDLFLVHRKSVVGVDAVRMRFSAVDEVLREHADAGQYLEDVSAARSRELSRHELAAVANPEEIIAGFQVPERSVDTQWLADRLAEALVAEPQVTIRTGVTVSKVVAPETSNGSWRVVGSPEVDENFDLVINALWQGRLVIDATAGIAPDYEWSHRYRLSVFAQTKRVVTTRSATICVGPFGDIKNYDGHEFYASWYPTGLMAEGNELTLAPPQRLSPDEEQRFLEQVRTHLGRLLPAVTEAFDSFKSVQIRGGFVFAKGRGKLSDPGASLHRRDRFGVLRAGNYISLDTGKYSTAPWMAEKLVREIDGE